MNDISKKLVHHVIRERPSLAHKGDFGRVALIGGSENYGGAILLASEAAVHSGVGLTTVITHPHNHAPLHARLPEAMVIDWHDIGKLQLLIPTVDVVVIGPGLGLGETSISLLQKTLALLCKEQICIIDGSAITLIAEHDITLPSPQDIHYIFTPHEKEWERLSGLLLSEQSQENNQAKQQALQSTVVLKKHRTEIYVAQEIWRNPLGTPAMATGGMGDTLAGMIGAFCAQFPDKKQALLAAVYLHSFLGETIAQTQYVALPSDIIKNISTAMKHFESLNI